jgi:hypothetical protein
MSGTAFSFSVSGKVTPRVAAPSVAFCPQILPENGRFFPMAEPERHTPYGAGDRNGTSDTITPKMLLGCTRTSRSKDFRSQQQRAFLGVQTI